jgi:hypothetical protein
MAALSASNWNPVLKAFHRRLTVDANFRKSSPRRLLNAMVRDNVVWAARIGERQHCADRTLAVALIDWAESRS